MSIQPQLETIAGLDCLTLRSPTPSTAVVVLHGYGANMHDLFPLRDLWHQEGFSWFFPNGTGVLPTAYYEGRSWFSIDIEKLEMALREGSHRDLSSTLPPELEGTLKQLEIFLRELGETFSKIILAGFSQGAMCASHLAVRPGMNVSGLILLSGGLIAQETFPSAAKGLPFYQSHGLQDPLLSVSGARLLEEKLRSLNFMGKLHLFEGGHEIPQSVIGEVKQFLALNGA